jgi:hypothetical protein
MDRDHTSQHRFLQMQTRVSSPGFSPARARLEANLCFHSRLSDTLWVRGFSGSGLFFPNVRYRHAGLPLTEASVRFRPSPPSASSSSSRLSASPAAQREPKREPAPVADCSALKSAVADCKPSLPVSGPSENTVKLRVRANARGIKRLKLAEAAHKTLTPAGVGRLRWRAA